MKCLKISVLITLILLMPYHCKACDDTLVMLLTAKNPTSEFSQTIRKFTTSLTDLGLSLKFKPTDEQPEKLEKVMAAWLDFTTRYMTNPPPEAKNDMHWTQKMQDASKTIGKIRKLIIAEKIMEAHNLVLELSGRIGTFFEAVGISDEKQLFLATSHNITLLEQKILVNSKAAALDCIASLSLNLADFKKLIPETASGTAIKISEELQFLENKLQTISNSQKLDPYVTEIKSMLEELRSHILMNEWFPETPEQEQGD
jgi:vacuolar-type H+-ATPase catalytic subunit A/Vma1